MTMRTRVYVIGDKALIAKLRKMSLLAVGPALDLSAHAGAEVFENKMKELVPIREGTLLDSIDIRKPG